MLLLPLQKLLRIKQRYPAAEKIIVVYRPLYLCHYNHVINCIENHKRHEHSDKVFSHSDIMFLQKPVHVSLV